MRNITAVTPARGRVVPGCGAFITGTRDLPVEDVKVAGVSISLEGGGTQEQSEVEPPQLETEYPEYESFGVLPSYGLYCRHARGITVDHLQVETRVPDGRPAILLQGVSSSAFRNLTLPADLASGESIVLRDCQNTQLER